MTTKFKVGDRVRVVKHQSHKRDQVGNIGEVGVVTNPHRGYCNNTTIATSHVHYEIKGRDKVNNCEDLELVKPKMILVYNKRK